MSSQETRPFIVGIGASAGGLEALRELVQVIPPNSNTAFVIIQHLSPDYESTLVELLGRASTVTVRPARNGVELCADEVYVIEPRTDLEVAGGRLVISEYSRAKRRGLHLPIDIFLRSLAADAGDFCAAVILSGTGSDGTRGLRMVKEAGGVVIIQSPQSARFDGMPRSAISTGLADLIMAPAAIPNELARIATGKPPRVDVGEGDAVLEPLQSIIKTLYSRFNVDFTQYKTATTARRLERRMMLRNLGSLGEYASCLQEDPEEIAQLFREMLIGVTRFFRDEEAFELLRREYLPQLIDSDSDQPLRLWVAACSTGEEAYSLAILLSEALRERGSTRSFRIFATDINPIALELAGRGRYPAGVISPDIPSPMLHRYFDIDGDGYRVRPELRERLIFSRHNIFEDPPFRRMDMVTCRNLLIYLRPDVQDRVMGQFRFSLRGGGLLWLGPSESISEQDDWIVENPRWRFFRAKGSDDAPVGMDTPLPPHTPRSFPVASRSVPASRSRVVLGDIYRALVPDNMPPVMVINSAMQLVFTFGDLSRVLQTPDGLVELSARDLLPFELGLLLPMITESLLERPDQELLYDGLSYEHRGQLQDASLRARALFSQGQQLTALFFDSLQPASSALKDTHQTSAQLDYKQQIALLEDQLVSTRERLQTTIEELETSNEEMQSTNEEMLSANEELQSTNEELHSVNEELHSVNAQYQIKITELSQLYSDLNDLLHSLDVGVLLLDQDIHIRRFNQTLVHYLPIIDQDIGRPLAHLRGGSLLDGVLDDIRAVLRDGVPIERTIHQEDLTSIRLLVSPTQVDQDGKNGAVVTLRDVGVQHELQRELDALRAALTHSPIPTVLLNLSGQIVRASQSFAAATGRDSRWLERAWLSDILGHSDATWFDELKATLSADVQWSALEQHRQASVLSTYRLISADGMPRWVLRTSLPVVLPQQLRSPPAQCWLCDDEGVIHMPSQAAALHGLPTGPQRLKLSELSATIHPDERAAVLAGMSSLPLQADARLCHLDGRIIPAHLTAVSTQLGPRRWIIGESIAVGEG